jgi:hypothetical protein
VRHIPDLGGQTDDERVDRISRAHDPLPPPLTREQEAILIAERLAALVESRRAGSTPPSSAPRSSDVVGARHSGRLLGNLLLTRGFVVEAELRYALARQASTGDPLGEILVDLGLITDRDLVELLAEQLRMQVVDLRRVDFDRATVALVSKHDAHRLGVLPIRQVEGRIEVAIADPYDEDAVDELMRRLGAPLRFLLATRADIDAAADRLYG